MFALLLSLPASAQSPQHSLTIHVTDPAGAPVAGARVAAALRDDRLLVVRVSDTTGNARFETVSPGTYVVDVDAPGFATAARTIAVRADMPSITISLNVAAVVEHVVVTGAGHLQPPSEVVESRHGCRRGGDLGTKRGFHRRRAAYCAGGHRSGTRGTRLVHVD